ncbi:MAG: FAD-dependent oxidoreductase, partial [Pygmaiobacter sp.]
FVPGTEKHLDVDTICIAVGLSPMSQLVRMVGCKVVDDPKKGGVVPVCNKYGETSITGIFSAGDVAGIEEASSAMIQGRISGMAAAANSGYLTAEKLEERFAVVYGSLDQLRQGMFSHANKGRTDLVATDEGYELSESLLKHGYVTDQEIKNFPSASYHKVGIHPVIECTQNIPCNPCQDACKVGCIKVGANITALPMVDTGVQCIGCGLCVANCSGQAIFLVNEDLEEGFASVTLPYEFMPLPEKGTVGTALGRSGEKLCAATVLDVRSAKALDHTNLLTMRVPVDFADSARFIQF